MWVEVKCDNVKRRFILKKVDSRYFTNYSKSLTI